MVTQIDAMKYVVSNTTHAYDRNLVANEVSKGKLILKIQWCNIFFF